MIKMELLLVLSILFWKPVYLLGYKHFYQKHPDALNDTLSWFKSLWVLIGPMEYIKRG